MAENERSRPSPNGPTGPSGRGAGEPSRPRRMPPAERGRQRIADRLDRAGRRLRRQGGTLEQKGGMKSKAGQAAERAGELAERGASYLRTRDTAEMRSDLEVRVRDRPLASMAVALAAGYLVGRLFG